ncbi:MAG: ClbS/DfsB family four-helix bundle protein [Chloroflexota bacterium]|nr:ClbS/DfsB family four-helix bundle protein [Chloroflexota bacterium]MDQ5865491.1 ClbS/DfsB family four-helix bundle protein [Chloroflexota bacterium]
MDPSLTKKQFIDTMRVERARWEMLLLRVGPGRMCVPVEGVGQSVGELVGALYEREKWLVERLASIQATEPTRAGMQTREVDTGSVAGVIAASRDAFNEMLRLLVPVCEADLFAEGCFDWAQGGTLAQVVAACTSNYYLEHDRPIRSWLSQPVTQAV